MTDSDYRDILNFILSMNENKFILELQKIGLTEKAALIYSVLLELGGAYPSKIAEYTKLNRSTVYKILTDLSNKGLVNEIEKRNKIYYQIEAPNKILQFANNKIKRAEEQRECAKMIMPEIEGLFSLIPNKPRIRFFEGAGVIESVYGDHVDTKETYEMLAYSNTAELMKVMPEKFRKNYLKIKEKLNIPSRGILPDTQADLKYNETIYKNVNKKIWPKLRFMPAEKFPYKIEITIYRKNRVSIINFSKVSLIGVIIEDQDIHDVMKMIFELAWIGAGSKM